MSHPQVSVIMPVFNAERYVTHAVKSILSQDFDDFEFLIFDDGSTDRSRSILEVLAARDQRIRLFQKDHRGHVRWLNEGLQLAKGRFIARMDADDVSLVQRFARQVEYLVRNPGCVAVGCDLLQIDPDGDPLGIIIHDTNHEAIVADLLSGGLGVISHPACMVRRSALQATGGYREEYEYLEDFDLWLRLIEHGQLANIPEVLFRYRLHHTNVIFTKVEQQKRLVDQIVSEARQRRGMKPLAHTLWSYKAPTLAERHQAWAWQAAGSGFYRSALKHAVISLRQAPLSIRSWAVLCSSLPPQHMRRLMKDMLMWTGIWRKARWC